MPTIVRSKPAIRNRPDSGMIDMGIHREIKPKREGEGFLLKVFPLDPGRKPTIDKFFPTIEARDKSQKRYREKGILTRRIG